MDRPSKLLIVDDQVTLVQNIERYMANQGYEVRYAKSGEGGLAVAEGFQPDIAIVDFRLPGLNGLETVAGLRARQPALRAIMITAHGDPALERQAAAEGIWRYLTKPVVLSDLKALVDLAASEVARNDEPSFSRRMRPDGAADAHQPAPSANAGRDDRVSRRAFLPIAASVLGLAVGAGGGYLAGLPDRGPRPIVPATAAEPPELELVEEIANYYLVFVGDARRPYELGASSQPFIEEWFSARLGRAFQVPDLSGFGLTFVGGRLMAVEEHSASLLIYMLPTGQPVGLCITDWERGELATTTIERKATHVVYWADDRSIYIVLGWTGAGFLWDLVDPVRRTMAMAERA